MRDSKWFLNLAEGDRGRIRLLCFPFAGGGAAFYRNWREKLPPDIDLVPVCLPGREQRFSEPAIDDIKNMMAPLLDELQWLTDKPYAFFGYSMGGIIAHHLACGLRAGGRPTPVHLMLAALRSPNEVSPAAKISELPTEAFWGRVSGYRGTPDEILGNAEYRALFEPMLRADFKLAQTATSNHLPQLDCPVTVFGGAQDTDPSPEQLDGWRDATTGPFECHLYAGGHFFATAHVGEMTACIARCLS